MQATIDQFSGSFNRDGMAVKGGFNAASVLSPMWADPSCQAGETPLEFATKVSGEFSGLWERLGISNDAGT